VKYFASAGSCGILESDLMITDYDELSRLIVDKVRNSSNSVAVDFANTQIVTMRRHDREFAALSECMDITVPDGMPLVWAMNAKGTGPKDRVYGPTFTRKFLQSCPSGNTHYIVGGSEECGRKFRELMTALNPSLTFIGGYHGGCSRDGILDNHEEVLAEIRERKPDFIWVGLGTPKQYAWINRIKPHLEQGIILAVGFALDVNAGTKSDAPMWMQRNGLTWVYLKWNSLFVFYLGREFLIQKLTKLRG
jgi:N-acetylglucosaminyldiphosphoundecaprenol N-acetyl-beta-D-mannosaminyltransferase